MLLTCHFFKCLFFQSTVLSTCHGVVFDLPLFAQEQHVLRPLHICNYIKLPIVQMLIQSQQSTVNLP